MKTRTTTELLASQDKQVRDTESQEQQRAIDKVDSWVPLGGTVAGGNVTPFKVVTVASPLTCIEQTYDGAFSNKSGASNVSVALYPQIDTTHYAQDDIIFAWKTGALYVSLYNQPAPFCEV